MSEPLSDSLAAPRPPAQPLPALTSLRFVAALAIVFHHCNGVFWPVAAPGPLDAGVSFFFVLSGFILTHVYGAGIAGRTAWRQFLVARIARIGPLHLACLAATILLLQIPEPPRIGPLLANALLVQAWIPFDRYFFSYNYVSWSISTELFFYLAFAFLVRRSPPTLLLWLGIALTGVAVLTLVSYEFALPVWQTSGNRLSSTGLLYADPVARIAEFMLGILTARLAARKPLQTPLQTSAQPFSQASHPLLPAASAFAPLTTVSRWRDSALELAVVGLFLLGFRRLDGDVASSVREARRLLGLLGLPMAAGGSAGPAMAAIFGEWWSHVGLAPLAAVVILVFARQRGVLSGLLSTRVPVFLGETSFALYLIHQIGLRWMQQHGLAPVGDQFRPILFAAYLGAMLLLAALLHLGLERPARHAIVHWQERRASRPGQPAPEPR